MTKLDELLNFLPTFWKKHEGSNNYAFFKSVSTVLDDLNDNIIALKNDIQINTAEGVYLDDLGELFNLTRKSGESDYDFRNRIKAYWQNYDKGGLKENIIKAFSNTLGIGEEFITLSDSNPLIINVVADITDFTGYSYPSNDVLEEVSNGVKAAGTKVVISFAITFSDDVYSYDDDFSISILGIAYVMPDDTYQFESLDVFL